MFLVSHLDFLMRSLLQLAISVFDVFDTQGAIDGLAAFPVTLMFEGQVHDQGLPFRQGEVGLELNVLSLLAVGTGLFMTISGTKE